MQLYTVEPVRRPRAGMGQNRMDNPAALTQLDALLFVMTNRDFVKAMEHIKSIAPRRLEHKNAQESGFMRLPPEIRDYIIELSMPEDTFVFEGSDSEDLDGEDQYFEKTWALPHTEDWDETGEQYDFEGTENWDDDAARTRVVRGPKVPSLMHTSRQLRREAAAVYYVRTAFIEDTDSLGDWLQQVPGGHRSLIRNVYSLNWRFNSDDALVAAQETDNKYNLRPGTSWVPWKRTLPHGPLHDNYEITLVNYFQQLKDARGIPEVESRWGAVESDHRDRMEQMVGRW